MMKSPVKLETTESCRRYIAAVDALNLECLSMDDRRAIWTMMGSFNAMCWLYEDLWASHYPESVVLANRRANRDANGEEND